MTSTAPPPGDSPAPVGQDAPQSTNEPSLTAPSSATVVTAPASTTVASAADGEGTMIAPWLQRSAGVVWRVLILVAAVVLAFYAVGQVQVVFAAIFIALVLTALLNPLVAAMSRVMPRAVATGVALLLGAIALVGLLFWVVLSVVQEWPTIATQVTAGIGDLAEALKQIPGLPDDRLDQWQSELQGWWTTDGQRWLNENQGNLLNQAFSGFASLGSIFATLLLAMFCTVFFLNSGVSMWKWFINQLPQRLRDRWVTGGEAGWETFSGYARSTVILSIATAVMSGIFLAAMGVSLWFPLTVLIFIGGFIPLIGPPVAMIVCSVVALATLGDVWKAIIVFAVLSIIGQISGNVLGPLVMGRQVSLHPVVVLVSVTAGGIVAGIMGAITVVPIVAVAWAIYSVLHKPDPPMTDAQFKADRQRVREQRKAAS